MGTLMTSPSEEFELVIETIKTIRRIRNDNRVPAGKVVPAQIKLSEISLRGFNNYVALIEEAETIERMAKCTLTFVPPTDEELDTIGLERGGSLAATKRSGSVTTPEEIAALQDRMLEFLGKRTLDLDVLVREFIPADQRMVLGSRAGIVFWRALNGMVLDRRVVRTMWNYEKAKK